MPESEMPESEMPESEVQERKPRAKRPALDLGAMSASIVKPEVVAVRQRTVVREGGAPTAARLAIRKLVKQVHESWVKAGKPEKWADRPGGNVQVPAEQAESFYSEMHNAAAFLDVKARRGQVTEFWRGPDGKPVPVGQDVPEGSRLMADIVFTVTDRPATQSDSSGEAGSTGAASTESNAG
jgi:hypothetical protein